MFRSLICVRKHIKGMKLNQTSDVLPAKTDKDKRFSFMNFQVFFSTIRIHLLCFLTIFFFFSKCNAHKLQLSPRTSCMEIGYKFILVDTFLCRYLSIVFFVKTLNLHLTFNVSRSPPTIARLA